MNGNCYCNLTEQRISGIQEFYCVLQNIYSVAKELYDCCELVYGRSDLPAFRQNGSQFGGNGEGKVFSKEGSSICLPLVVHIGKNLCPIKVEIRGTQKCQGIGEKQSDLEKGENGMKKDSLGISGGASSGEQQYTDNTSSTRSIRSEGSNLDSNLINVIKENVANGVNEMEKDNLAISGENTEGQQEVVETMNQTDMEYTTDHPRTAGTSSSFQNVKPDEDEVKPIDPNYEGNGDDDIDEDEEDDDEGD